MVHARQVLDDGGERWVQVSAGNGVGLVGSVTTIPALEPRFGPEPSPGGGFASQSSVGWRMLYTGREWDATARLYNYRFRWYSPTLGRFTSRDPIGYGGGLNQYMYVDGNPVFWSDPLGLSAKVPWNPLTWLDSDGSERVTDPRSWWTFGGAGQGGAFVEGAAQGHIGWSNGFLNTISFGFVEDYSDWCNTYQKWGDIWGTVSGIAAQNALFWTAAGAGEGANFRVLSANSKVPVTSWSPKGIQPNMEPGRWVMLGERTRANLWLTGTRYPFKNGVTQLVRWGDLTGVGIPKSLLGQARIGGVTAIFTSIFVITEPEVDSDCECSL